MKKTFKRFLSSALAAVMAASVLSVGMVSGVYAAEITKTYTFGTDNADLETDSKDFFTITADSKKEDTDHTALPSKSTIKFTIPNNATDISIVVKGKAHSSGTEQTIKLTNSVSNATGAQSKMSASTGDPVEVTWKTNNYATGENTVTCTGAEIDYYYIKVAYTETESELKPLAEGEYTTKEQFEDKANFNLPANAINDSGQLKIATNAAAEFMLNEKATLTVTYRSGSSNAGRTGKAVICKDDGTTTLAEGSDVEKSDECVLTCEIADAGTYKLVSKSVSTTTQIVSIDVKYNAPAPAPAEVETPVKAASTNAVGYIKYGNTYYVISVVEKEAAKTAATIEQQTGATENNVIGSSDTVYTGLSINGETYTPSQLMNGATDDGYYVFASAINAELNANSVINEKTMKTRLTGVTEDKPNVSTVLVQP